MACQQNQFFLKTHKKTKPTKNPKINWDKRNYHHSCMHAWCVCVCVCVCVCACVSACACAHIVYVFNGIKILQICDSLKTYEIEKLEFRYIINNASSTTFIISSLTHSRSFVLMMCLIHIHLYKLTNIHTNKSYGKTEYTYQYLHTGSVQHTNVTNITVY